MLAYQEVEHERQPLFGHPNRISPLSFHIRATVDLSERGQSHPFNCLSRQNVKFPAQSLSIAEKTLVDETLDRSGCFVLEGRVSGYSMALRMTDDFGFCVAEPAQQSALGSILIHIANKMQSRHRNSSLLDVGVISPEKWLGNRVGADGKATSLGIFLRRSWCCQCSSVMLERTRKVVQVVRQTRSRKYGKSEEFFPRI